jgi:hypothetical protein
MAPGPTVWSRFSADPRVPGSADLKATDADRDVATETLRDAYADGRLTRGEYDERSSAVLDTRTVGALLPLLVDLVPLGTPPTAVDRTVRDLHAKAERRYQRDLRDARNGWLFVSVVTCTIWVVTSLAGDGPYFFWPIFPIVGVGIGFVSIWLNADKRIEAYEDGLAETRRLHRRRRRELD